MFSVRSRIEPFRAQCERIRLKIGEVRAADPEYQVFGASSHRYQIGRKLWGWQIGQFERQYLVSLPDAYIAFLILVGSAGRYRWQNAAGPKYGLLPFGTCPEDFPPFELGWLAGEPLVRPDISNETWEAYCDELCAAGQNASQEAWNELETRLYAGVLPVCHQGCSGYSGVMLAGPQKGRIVNFTTEPGCPSFTPFENFLYWYEGWLDDLQSSGKDFL